MIRINRILLMSLMLLVATAANAQSKNFMRDNGRIYVVVAVMVTILLGLILYLVRLDKKISKIEKEK